MTIILLPMPNQRAQLNFGINVIKLKHRKLPRSNNERIRRAGSHAIFNGFGKTEPVRKPIRQTGHHAVSRANSAFGFNLRILHVQHLLPVSSNCAIFAQ